MPRLFLIAIVVATVVAAPNHLSGQDGHAEPVMTADLVPVDQTVADHNPLSASLRIGNPGIDEPNDFAELFRLPGEDGRLVRAQGGLYAIFASSIYTTNDDDQPVPAVSPDTLFHIGRPMSLAGPLAPMTAAATYESLQRSPVAHSLRLQSHVDFRQDSGQADETTSERRRDRVFKRRGIDRPVPGPRPELGDDDTRTIANDPAYRAARMRSILVGF